MAKVAIKNIEFHSGFMLASKNFTQKVAVGPKEGVDAYWDSESDRIIVTYKGVSKQFQSYHNFEPVNPADIGVKEKITKQEINKKQGE